MFSAQLISIDRFLSMYQTLSLEVLFPHSSNMHFSMSVPTSGIRSATCQVEFDTELQHLKIVWLGLHEKQTTLILDWNPR